MIHQIHLFVILPLFISFTIWTVLLVCWYRSLCKKNKDSPARPLDLTKGGGKILTSLWKVNKAILQTLNFEELTEEVVNVVLKELNYLQIGYRVSVLTLIDKEAGIVRRISFSPTPEAFRMLKKANIRFHDIKIPLTAKENLLVKAIENQQIYITHDLADVLLPEKSREVWEKVQEVAGIKTSLVFPLIIHGESIGAMIFSLSKSEKEITDNEKGILGGFTDAVAVALENANLYRRLKKANKKLKELDKRKDEFLSVAAHELRAPMTAIKGYLSMILEGDAGQVSQKIREFLDDAVSGNDRLIRLVNNMLNVSRIEEGRLTYEMGVVCLAKVADDVYDDFIAEAEEKGLSISLKSPSDIKDRVYVDKDRIHEVIGNLISNAVKYTDKGSVTVRLSNPTPQTIRLEVIDTGSGISEKDQGELFKKFSRAETSAGKAIGSGLGLYISKLLVEKFGGKIGFDSQLGKGSTFWFELPRSNH